MASVGSMEVNINTVINKLNAGHLLENVRWIRENFDFIKHFNWNNMDPAMASGSGFDKALIPRLNDFELSLYNAMAYLVNEKCTFRAERVPLCYMTYFAAYSTETRKIVKDEERRVYFLDKRGIFEQQRWDYDKAPACLVCSVNDICAGLYRSDAYYSARELYPLFIKKNEIIDAIRSHA